MGAQRRCSTRQSRARNGASQASNSACQSPLVEAITAPPVNTSPSYTAQIWQSSVRDHFVEQHGKPDLQPGLPVGDLLEGGVETGDELAGLVVAVGGVVGGHRLKVAERYAERPKEAAFRKKEQERKSRSFPTMLGP